MAIQNARRSAAPSAKGLDCRGIDIDCPRLRRRNWETRFGCWAAISLTVLEVKRLLLLTLEMLVDSRAIRFAGALLPIIFSFVDVGLGFPIAIGAVYAIRKHKVRPCQPKIKQTLRKVVLTLTMCALLNVATVVLIGFYVNSNAHLLKEIFKATMKVYAKNAHYKVTIDELQLDLQCCGFSSYSDWFGFDWQVCSNFLISIHLYISYIRFNNITGKKNSNYADSEDEEEFNDQSVPFSCCNKRSMWPCIHMEMRFSDERTINRRGCADVISRILYKVAVVGYTMTGIIIGTQILMIIFFIRIIRRVFPEICPSECSCWEETCPLNTTFINYSSDDCTSHCPEKFTRGLNKKKIHHPVQTIVYPRKICRRPRDARKVCGNASSRCSSRTPFTTTCSSSDSGSSTSSCGHLTSSPSFTELAAARRVDSANIDPSTQQQHQIPQRRKQIQ